MANEQIVDGVRIDALWATIETGTNPNATKYKKKQRCAPRTLEKAITDDEGINLSVKLKNISDKLSQFEENRTGSSGNGSGNDNTNDINYESCMQEIEQLQSNVEGIQNGISSIQDNVNNATSKVNELQNNVATMQNQVDSIQNNINDVRTNLNIVSNKAHTHANKEILDKFSETTDGELLYNGSAVRVNISIDSSLDETSENPVQNKAIKKYIDDTLSTFSGDISGIIDQVNRTVI